jgi:hypothetical protein
MIRLCSLASLVINWKTLRARRGQVISPYSALAFTFFQEHWQSLVQGWSILLLSFTEGSYRSLSAQQEFMWGCIPHLGLGLRVRVSVRVWKSLHVLGWPFRHMWPLESLGSMDGETRTLCSEYVPPWHHRSHIYATIRKSDILGKSTRCLMFGFEVSSSRYSSDSLKVEIFCKKSKGH